MVAARSSCCAGLVDVAGSRGAGGRGGSGRRRRRSCRARAGPRRENAAAGSSLSKRPTARPPGRRGSPGSSSSARVERRRARPGARPAGARCRRGSTRRRRPPAQPARAASSCSGRLAREPGGQAERREERGPPRRHLRDGAGLRRGRAGRVGLDLVGLAPLRARLVLLPLGVEGEAEVEADERVAGCSRRELAQPLDGPVRPGGDGRARRRPRANPGRPRGRPRTRARGRRLAAVVRPLGGSAGARLGVVGEEDAELEGGGSAPRARARRPADERTPRRPAAAESGRADDEPDARAGGHAPSVAARLARAKSLYSVKQMASYRELLQQVKARSTRSTPARAALS